MLFGAIRWLSLGKRLLSLIALWLRTHHEDREEPENRE
jgi:hypothetical protein